MDLRLHDSVVLVAGSSRGIGLAIARAFLCEGAKVMVTGRDESSLLETSAALEKEFGKNRVVSFAGDMTKADVIQSSIVQLQKTFGDPDCVVGNVGRGRLPLRVSYTEEQWTDIFEENLHGSIRLAQAVVPLFQKKKKGSLVFTSSIAGVEDIGAPLPYASAKAALILYAKGLARQVGKDNVRVNCVAPGNIFFPGGSWEKRLKENKKGVEEHIAARVPMQRFGTPEEIADLVVFLSSPLSSFTTGTCVVSDGGQTASL